MFDIFDELITDDLPTCVQKNTDYQASSPKMFLNNYTQNESQEHITVSLLYQMMSSIGQAVMDGTYLYIPILPTIFTKY